MNIFGAFEGFHMYLLDNPLLSITFKLVLGYFLLLVVSRLTGKKELSQYTVFDFIFVVMLTGFLEEVIYHHDTPWYEVIVAVGVWSIINFIVTKLELRFESLRPIIKGQPVFLVRHGEIQVTALKENNLEMEQLRHALRSRGVFSLREVDYAVLETNGEVNVLPKIPYQHVTRKEIHRIEKVHDDFPYMVIEEGKLVPEERSGISEEVVMNHLKENGIERVEHIFYAEVIGDTFYYTLKGGGDNGKANNETN